MAAYGYDPAKSNLPHRHREHGTGHGHFVSMQDDPKVQGQTGPQPPLPPQGGGSSPPPPQG